MRADIALESVLEVDEIVDRPLTVWPRIGLIFDWLLDGAQKTARKHIRIMSRSTRYDLSKVGIGDQDVYAVSCLADDIWENVIRSLCANDESVEIVKMRSIRDKLYRQSGKEVVFRD